MTSETCDTCGGRERTAYLEDGVCRDCRGLEKPDPMHHSAHVSPDRAERNPEAVAHAEAKSRHRVLRNASGRL